MKKVWSTSLSHAPLLEQYGLTLIFHYGLMLSLWQILGSGYKTGFQSQILLIKRALWFYGQFVCTLWSLWLHRNKVLFKKQSLNPIGIIHHQKHQVRWIYEAFQSQTGNTPCRSRHQNITNIERSSAIPNQNSISWIMFLKVVKNKGTNQCDTYAFIRGPERSSIIINRSYTTSNKRHAQLLILREALICLKGSGFNLGYLLW